MKINLKLELDCDRLIQRYCDSQDTATNNCDPVNILRNELLSWLDELDVEVEAIEEVSS